MMYRIEFPIFNKPITPEITHKDSKISDFNADYKLKIDTFEDWQVANSEVRKNLQKTLYFKKAVISKYYDFFMLY